MAKLKVNQFVELVKRSGEGQRIRRDPAQMLELLMPV